MGGEGKRVPGAALIAAGCVAWSFSGILGKWAPWGPLSIIGARALVAALVFARVRGGFAIRPSPATWLGAAGVALTSVLFITANKLTTAANAIVLQYAMPAVVIIGSALFLGQRATRLDILAAAATMLGVALCFVSGFSAGNLLGDVLAITSAVTFSLVFFSARLPGADPVDYSYLGNVLSCACLAAIPLDARFAVTWQAVLAALLMGICLTLGYLLFSRGMKAGVSPIAASIVANIEPVLNPIWVFLLLGEKPGLFTLLGAALVLCSVTVYSILNARRAEALARAQA